ncbi:MAG: type III-B CRISPR module RAMP protein Cmr6 [Pseudonocardiaceae bacterium]
MNQPAGPLGRVIRIGAQGSGISPGANPLIPLRRVAVVDQHGALDDKAQRDLLGWAAQSGLGQNSELIGQVARRRARMLAELRDQGQTVIRLRAEPEWRMVVGLGERGNPHEIGMALHGTYGWPVISGSSLKGLAAAWAALDVGTQAPKYQKVFGTTERCGGVTFLDAIPAGAPVDVVLDVLTPHHQQYYTTMTTTTATASASREPVPPAEYHNPVPVHFLTVTGAFAVDLVGGVRAEVEQAAKWLTAAGDELGAGAKTSSGYGYLKISEIGDEERHR